jgi:beta-galactosidase
MKRKHKVYNTLSVCIILATLIISGFTVQPKNDNRIRYSINNLEWKFFLGEASDAWKKNYKTSDWLNITIPHDFNGGIDGVNNSVFLGRFDFKNDPDKRLMYKGPGWYRTTFIIDEQYKGKKVFIEFEAVSLDAQVWVNGVKAGGHKGGYTAFTVDITERVKFGSENTLAVRADNSNNPAIAPWMADEKNSFPYSFDYAVYGGIYRDVWITITDPVRIEKILNTPVCGAQAPAVLTVETRVKNYSRESREVTLQTIVRDPDGNIVTTLKAQKIIPAGEEITFRQNESSLGKVQLWDVNDPRLYNVTSILSCDGVQVDTYESVFGFRYFTLQNNTAFLLNGHQENIRGVNRHQDMEGFGYAVPNEQHRKDVELIKEAGFNFVRHAHYPADRAFVKACDELGIMLWLEIPLTGSTSADPAFAANCKNQLTEMIEEFYNDPSVVVWGIGNESDRSGAPESVSNKVFGELVNLAKELDPTRPTTGCNYEYRSNQELVNVYAPQDWSGWYSGGLDRYRPSSLIGEYGADIHYENHTDQRFDPGIDYNLSGMPECWSQEYGAMIHEYKVSVAQERSDQFPGQCVWVAFDFASPRLGRGINPIPYMNQKGILLHDHKTPKDIYYFYQSMYRKPSDHPMVYIVSESWTDRWTEPAAKDIWAYSNCDSVELFNDYGRTSLGVRTKTAGPRGDTRFQWDSAYVQYNVLYAEGWYQNIIAVRDTLILENLKQPE